MIVISIVIDLLFSHYNLFPFAIQPSTHQNILVYGNLVFLLKLGKGLIGALAYAHYDTNLSMDDNLDCFCRIFGKGTDYIADNIRLMRMAFRYPALECHSDFKTVESCYRQLKEFTIPERGELLYMRDNFDSYAHPKGDGFGIAIPMTGETMDYEPDKWYMFE